MGRPAAAGDGVGGDDAAVARGRPRPSSVASTHTSVSTPLTTSVPAPRCRERGGRAGRPRRRSRWACRPHAPGRPGRRARARGRGGRVESVAGPRRASARNSGASRARRPERGRGEEAGEDGPLRQGVAQAQDAGQDLADGAAGPEQSSANRRCMSMHEVDGVGRQGAVGQAGHGSSSTASAGRPGEAHRGARREARLPPLLAWTSPDLAALRLAQVGDRATGVDGLADAGRQRGEAAGRRAVRRQEQQPLRPDRAPAAVQQVGVAEEGGGERASAAARRPRAGVPSCTTRPRRGWRSGRTWSAPPPGRG